MDAVAQRVGYYYDKSTGAIERVGGADQPEEEFTWTVSGDRVCATFPGTIKVEAWQLEERNTGKSLRRHKDKIIVDVDNGYAEYTIDREQSDMRTIVAHRTYLWEK